VIAPGGGKEPGRGARGCPGSAEEGQWLFREGNIPVFSALAAVDRDLKTGAIDVGDLQEGGFVESESQAIDGREGDVVVQGGSGRQEALDLLHTEDGGEPVGGVRTQEREGVPVALENVRREEAEPPGAEAQGRRGQTSDIFPVEEVALEFLCRDAVGGGMGALSQEADFPDRRCLSPFALATEVESRNHVLTQWGHEISPFVSEWVIRLRRKTS
jgi:hypothetical protein